MTTTAVPTIRDTIVNALTANGYREYARMPVVDQIVTALVDREVTMNGDTGVGQPVTDETQRRLSSVGTAESDEMSLAEQVARLAMTVDHLVAFARQNGYPMLGVSRTKRRWGRCLSGPAPPVTREGG